MKIKSTTKIKSNCKKMYDKICDFGVYIDECWKKIINSKFLKPIFNVLPHNIFIFILMLITFFLIFKSMVGNNSTILYNQGVANDVFDPMIANPVDISFENISTTSNPNEICITFATYAKKTNSDYKFVLYKQNSKKKDTIKEEYFNSNILEDGKSHCFEFEEVNKEELKDYSASIVPVYTDLDNVITIFKNKDTNIATFTLNHKSDVVFGFKQFIAIFFMIAFFIINYLINCKRIKTWQYWILVSLVYTLPLVFIYPPYEVPDEPVHYYNAYKFSQIDLHKSLQENIENPAVYAPKNMSCLNYSQIETRDKVIDFNEALECAKEQGNALDYTYGGYNYVNGKLGYIIPGAAIKVVDKVTDSPVAIFYSGRVMNYIVSTLIILIAIMLAPKYKETILFVGTIPMFVQQAGSYSYDSIVNSLSLLIVSIILKMIENKKNNKLKFAVILVMLGMVIANIKMIYLVVLLMLLLLPERNFKKKFNKYLYCFSIIAISYILGKLTQGIFFNGNIPSTVGSSENLNLILSNPLKIFSLAYNTFALKGMFYLRSLFGYFTWFKFKLNDIFMYSYILMIIYLIFNNKGIESKVTSKSICWLGLLICFAGTFAAMYFSWSQPGLYYVEGVQGRYFLAILLPFILLCMSKKNKYSINDGTVYSYVNVVLIYYVILALMMFY